MALFVFGGCLIRLTPRVPALPAALILRLRLWVHTMTNEACSALWAPAPYADCCAWQAPALTGLVQTALFWRAPLYLQENTGAHFLV